MNNFTGTIERLLKSDPNRETAWVQMLQALLTTFHSETGTIHRLDDGKQMLLLVAQAGLPAKILEVVKAIPVGKGIAGQVVARGKPVAICNLQTDTSEVARPGARQAGMGGALCVPLRHGNEIVGTLGIGTVRQHEYTVEETRELEEAARLIGPFLNP